MCNDTYERYITVEFIYSIDIPRKQKKSDDISKINIEDNN